MAKDTKERILTEALEMFSQKGYEGTNIRELSASEGLQGRTLLFNAWRKILFFAGER